ncbi:MAG: DUF3169 family protein [Clostridia bacterium]|nr:DUF3169 family protein [Clostridia bacterium]
MKNSVKNVVFISVALAAAVVLGYSIGGQRADAANERIRDFLPTLAYIVPVVMGVLNVVLLTLALLKYIRAKKLSETIDEDDAQTEFDRRITTSEAISLSSFVISVILFSVSFAISTQDYIAENQKRIVFTVSLAIFLAGALLTLVLQCMLFALRKKVMPEKRGVFIGFSADKDWDGASDEGEMAAKYKAAYRSFGFTSKMCLWMTIPCIVAAVMFKAGVLPIICICIIFLAMMISYYSGLNVKK